MTRALFAAALFAFSSIVLADSPVTSMPARVLEGPPPALLTWRAPNRSVADLVSLPAPAEAKLASQAAWQPGTPLKVATHQVLDSPAEILQWSAAPGGFVAKFRVTSASAAGIRTRLELGTVPGTIEARVQGSESPIIEFMPVDPTLGNTHWTPWTEGASQVIELFTPVMPSAGAVSVGAVAHFTDSPLTTKAGAAECTVSAQCSTNDSVLDAAIVQARKSVAKMLFATTEGQFLCTATLLNSTTFPAPFLVTANHCISDSLAAGSLTTFWFYETTSCDDVSNSTPTQVAGGSQLVFTNYNVDSTLLRMNRAPPTSAVFSAWNKALVAGTTPIVSLSHPKGDSTRLALGSVATELRIDDRPYDMYAITFTRGIIEGGSSGSGLFVLNNSTLELRGILTGSTVRNDPGGLSCTDLDELAVYDRFEVFEPEIDQYLTGAARTDDAPNLAQDLFGKPITDPNGVDKPLDQRTGNLVFTGRNIDYAGDIDVYRFSVASSTSVHVWTTGSTDTVGTLLDSTGKYIVANDDESHASTNFGITKTLAAGTYYVAIGAWDPNGTGAYSMNFSAASGTPVAANYTDLWWGGASESGWGLNVNHQGSTVFATLFTYDASGAPMWLVLANGAQQSDGSFTGALYRTTGSPFNALPWNPANDANTQVGTMTLRFSSTAAGTLSYTVNGASVTKQISRQPFSTPAACSFTAGDRSGATNYQDLWWNPSESGWGVNVTHQGDVIFATLFDYDLTGQGTWYVLANAPKLSGGVYSGDLFRVTGPVFNASPWTPTTATKVGTMTFQFSSGNAGILNYNVNGVQVTKAIQREVFSTPTTQCQ
ncbi:MAG TPA: DVUA0089 family protein [Usitatibacter sp.]|nr:DVUA0089 family protein [Usitatibacter sp.]